MKIIKKTLLCLAAFAILLCLFCACKSKKQDGGSTDNGGGGTSSDNNAGVIFSSEVDVTFITPSGVNISLAAVKDQIVKITGKHAESRDDSFAKGTAEIVFGVTSREISGKAMAKLNSALEEKRHELEEMDEKTKYLEGVLFYAEGDSLAVVWSDDALIDRAVEYLVSSFMNAPTLSLNNGYSHFVTFDSLEVMAENEAEAREEQYAAIRDAYGEDVENAIRTHLGMFGERYYMWLADLYDPGEYDEEGNPLGGGFYFSNSGRDTPGFGVDLESTAQVLAFLRNSGMLPDDDMTNDFPEEIQEQMVAFALACQSPVDGYFYHPQWGTDVKDSRRSRDCGWAVRILNYFGEKPYWNTPAGAEGQYGDPPGAEPVSALSSRLSESSVSAVSKVVATAGKKWTGSSQLKSLDAWRAYLDELFADIRTKSYNIGNTVASQASQIENREKIAKENGEQTGYIALFEEYFNGYQLENGLWEECSVEDGTVYYNAINGLMKISGGYNSLGVKFNYAEEAIRAACYMITHIGISKDGSDWTDSKGKLPDGSVDVYNPWVSINNVLKSVRTFEGDDAAEDLRNRLIKPYALEMIETTTRKIAMFARDDGSYCYNWGTVGSTSQGALVAVAGTMEGDVNGGNIAFTGTLREMVNALGIKISPFGYSDFLKFSDRIEELGQVIKDDEVFDEDAGKFTFDDDAIDSGAPTDVTLSMNTGSVQVERDLRDGASGNVLKFTTHSGAGSTMTYKPGTVKNALGAALEWEMCFESWGEKTGTMFQIRIGDGYMFTVGIDKNGMMTIGDASSTGTGISTKFDAQIDPTEWNKFRVEFYVLDSETRSTVTRIYINDEPRFVSDNYFGKESALTPTMKYTYAKFYGLSSYDFVCYFDNIVARAITEPYADLPLVNPDRIKDFEGGEMPNGVTTEGGVIEKDNGGNVLVLDGNGKNVSIGATVAAAGANCYALNTKMKIESDVLGEAALLCLSRDGSSKAITAFKAVIYEEDGKKLAKLVEFDRSGNAGTEIGGLPVGEWFELTVEFYPYFYESADETSIVYLNGEEIGRGTLYYYIGTVAGPYNHFYVETIGDVRIALDDVVPESIVKKFVDEDGETVEDPDVTLPESGSSSNTAAKDNHNGRFDFEGYEDGTPKIPGLQVNLNADEYENRIIVVTDPKNAANKLIKHTVVKSSSGSSSMFTASKISPAGASVYVQSFDLYVDSFTAGGIQTSIKGKVGTKEVNMFQTNINISAADGEGTIQIKSKRDAAGDLAEGQETANTIVVPTTRFSGRMNIRFELYTELGIVQIYINDQLRGETDAVYTARMDADYYRGNIFTVSSTVCTMYYDNVVVEAVEKAYEAKTPVSSDTPIGGTVTPDTPDVPGEGGGDAPVVPEAPVISGVYDFEGYQTGTSAVDGLTANFTNGYSIVMEDPRSAAGRVLEYHTLSGANEALIFAAKTSENAKTFILEFDFMLVSTAKDGSLMQIKLDTSYMFSMSVKEGQLQIKDASTTSGGASYCRSQDLFTVPNASEFHSFRVEYSIIEGNAYIKFYVDGELKAVSGNYYDGKGTIGAPTFQYTKAQFSSLSSAEFVANIDNVSVIQSDAVSEKADYTHYAHIIGNKFEYTPITDAVDFENGEVFGGIVGVPTVGDSNYVSSFVVTDAKDAVNKVLRINIGSLADCKATSTYMNSVTPSNHDKAKDDDGNYVQGSGAYVFSYDFRYDGAAPTKEEVVADVIFNHTPRLSSGYWNHIQLAMTASGALKIKMVGNKDDTPNRNFAQEFSVINDGEWHNIRIIAEKCGADSAISVFLDDVCLIYKLNCYYDSADVDANSYVSSVLWRQRKTTFDYAVELDNLYFEYIGDYDILSGLVK